MLTIRPCKDYGHELGQYLRQADYYSEGLKVDGYCIGKLCDALGLKAGITITDAQFEALARNEHPTSGNRLTQRMAAERRAGYDCVFSAPKSVSIQAFVGGDERLVAAHDKAVAFAFGEMEDYACQQTGQTLNKRHVRTACIAAAIFRHGESRALDPQLHSHAFVFNATKDVANSRLIALETAEIFARTNYITEIYRNELARQLTELGYKLDTKEHGFELAGVSVDLIERFSKRAQARDVAVAAREKELGRKLSADEIAVIVRANRQRKLVAVTPQDVRALQISQVSAEELAALKKLRSVPHTRESARDATLSACIANAKEHVFERQAVVPDYDIAAEIIRGGYGQLALADINAAIAHGHSGLLVIDGRVSTIEAIQQERDLIAAIDRGVGVNEALGQIPPSTSLSVEQRKAVERLLNCNDNVVIFQGRAGTGKTTSIATVIEGCTKVGREVACFAPSMKAVEILRDGGEHETHRYPAASKALSSTQTIQRLLVDPKMQASVTGKLLIVDEFGLLSTRDLKRLVDLAALQNCRLMLVGDSAQHTSVEASAAARVLERESRTTVAQLGEVRRQAPNRGYLRAAQALASGCMQTGLARLDDIGAIVEIRDTTERHERMVEEWFSVAYGSTKAGRLPNTALMVAPTWNEISEINHAARERLRIAGVLRGEDRVSQSLWPKDWTRAQKKDSKNYRPDNVLVAHKRTKSFDKGDEMTVVRCDGDRLVLRNTSGGEMSVSAKQSGLAWTVCDQRPISVAVGDQLRLRAAGHVRDEDGKIRRVANGCIITVAGLDAFGRPTLLDGSVLLSRQYVHGYATTSHAAQGVTVDAVFMANPITREGLYVSATRGRESVRIFTRDRKELLDAVRLKTEDRMSASEFARGVSSRGISTPENSPYTSMRHRIRTTVNGLRAFWSDGVERSRELAVAWLQHLQRTRPKDLVQNMRRSPRTTGVGESGII